jgi:hypothetical protein
MEKQEFQRALAQHNPALFSSSTMAADYAFG